MDLPPEDRDLFDLAERVEADVCESMWAAAPAEVRELLEMAHERIAGAFIGIAPRLDVPMYNRAFRFGLAEPIAEDALDAIVARLRAANAPRAFVQVVPGARLAHENAGEGDTIAARLETHGLRRYNRWIRLVRDPKAPLPAAAGNAAWRVEQIGPERAADFARIDASAFGTPPVLEAWCASLVGLPGWRAYLAYDGETPIACAATYQKDAMAWNGFAGTLEAYRGKGAQSALIARRLADAAEAGCRAVVLETAEDKPEKPAPSYHNQLRFGFRPLYARENWLLAGGAATTAPPKSAD